MRRDLLKAYLLALLAEGQFRSSSYGEMLSRSLAILGDEVPSVLGEIGMLAAGQLASRGLQRVSDAVLETMNRVAQTAARRGFSGIWEDLKAAYQRGAQEDPYERGGQVRHRGKR